MTCDAKFVSYSENFSRKFYCPMIKNFGPVSPEQLWNKFIPTEFETKKPLRFRVGYISQIFLKIDFLKDYLTKFQIFRFSDFGFSEQYSPSKSIGLSFWTAPCYHIMQLNIFLFLCLITTKFSISLVMFKVGPSPSKFIKNIRLKESGAKASWQFRVASSA